MALSDKQILEELANGNIIISPFNKQNLSSSSYDVTLGNQFYRPNVLPYIMYNPYSKASVESTWKLSKAIRWIDSSYYVKSENILEDDYVIVIAPGETILCHTNEFIGGKNNITTMMKSRSSIGRNFLETCSCSGWGDVGYINRWTMEIRNNSTLYYIPLIVGRRVAQIVFISTGETSQQYFSKYQNETDIVKLIENWKPEDMLPKMYLDREITE